MSDIPHFDGRAAFLLRTQRFMDRLTEQLDRALAARGLSITVQQAGCVQALFHAGPASLARLAAELGISHQLVSHRINGLVRLGHVETSPDPQDARKRVVSLTVSGRDQAERLQPFLDGIDAAYADLFSEIGVDLNTAVEAATQGLSTRPVLDRMSGVLATPV